jgi:hypothetical protein
VADPGIGNNASGCRPVKIEVRHQFQWRSRYNAGGCLPWIFFKF